MRRHFGQFTVRLLMVAIAIIALTLGVSLWGVKMRRLSLQNASRAQRYAFHETLCLEVDEVIKHEANEVMKKGPIADADNIDGSPHDDIVKESEKLLQAASYYAALKRKYERVARYPWLPLEPDLPTP